MRIVSERSDHPTAHSVYTKLRREKPNTSLGNVYRNLSILVEEGRVARRKFRYGVERYDAMVGDHCHFICEQCGSVSDVDMPLPAGIAAQARRRTRLTIRSYAVQLYGLCRRCAIQRRKM